MMNEDKKGGVTGHRAFRLLASAFSIQHSALLIQHFPMYLASFELGDSRLVQGCLRLPCLPAVTERQRGRWWDEFRRLMRAGDAVPGGDGAVRVVLGDVGQGGLPDRLLFASAPAPAEADLRRYLAS